MKIRSDILRTYQAIHTWTGITTGLLLFIGFFAGALTMFQGTIARWATPPHIQLEQIAPSQLDNLVQQTLQVSPGAAKELTLHFDPQHSPITWFEKGSARGLRLDDELWHATLNEQGELVKQLVTPNELGDLLDYLHRTAGIIGEVGHEHAGVYILGFAAILYFLALVSGIIFLLPTLVKSFFALRNNKGASRFWLDSHNLIGIVSLPFHIVIALTAVVFAFHDFYYDGLSQVYGEQPLFERSVSAENNYQVSQLPSIQQHINKAEAYAANFQQGNHQVASIRFAGLSGKHPMATLTMVNEQSLMRGPSSDYLFMNPYSLEVVNSSYPPGEEGIWGRMVSSFFALHFGSYGGDLGRWLYFLLGLGGAFLFYSGNLIWLEKRRKKKVSSQGKSQSRSTHFMASLTVGMCLGSIAGISAAMLATKWLSSLAININSAYLYLYYGFFFFALAYAFFKGAAQAAIHLLKLISLLCLLIPASSLIALILPDLAPWPANNLESISVELTALVFAAVFNIIASRTQTRAESGEENSVWSIKSKASENAPVKQYA